MRALFALRYGVYAVCLTLLIATAGEWHSPGAFWPYLRVYGTIITLLFSGFAMEQELKKWRREK